MPIGAALAIFITALNILGPNEVNGNGEVSCRVTETCGQ